MKIQENSNEKETLEHFFGNCSDTDHYPAMGGMNVSYAESATSGTRDGLSWNFDTASGELVISGTGEVPSWCHYWDDYEDQVKTLIIQDGITAIGKSAFEGWDALESITLADSVKTISDYAIFNDKYLSTINLGQGVETIGKDAFCNDYSLISVTIPASVTYIGEDAFYRNLSTIYFMGACPTLFDEDEGDEGNGTFPSCSLTAYILPQYASTYDTSKKYGAHELKWVSDVETPYIMASQSDNSLVISWRDIPVADAYEVQRAKKGGSYSTIGETSELSLVDNTASFGTIYTYRVRTILKGTSEDYYSSWVKINAALMGTPSGLSAAQSKENIKLSWNAVTNAKSYNVYKRSKDGEYSCVANVSDTNWSDSDAITEEKNYYCVTAVYSDTEKTNCESSKCSEVSCTLKSSGGSADTYSYEITPVFENFCNYVYVKTDNPDMTNYRLVDKTVDGKNAESTFNLSKVIYKDVQYENESTYRVNDGYIFVNSDTAYNSGSDGGKLYLQVYKSGNWSDTGVTIKCPKLVDVLEAAIDQTDSSMTFWEKMNVVQSYLSTRAVYPFVFQDDTKEMTSWPYYYANSVEDTSLLTYYGVYPSAGKLLLKTAYPFVLNSYGLPSVIEAAAKEFDSSCSFSEVSGYHYLVNITLNGETKTYGGAGTGSSYKIIYVSDISRYFTFTGSSSDYYGASYNTWRDTILNLGKEADTKCEKIRDKYLKTNWVKSTANGCWVKIKSYVRSDYALPYTYFCDGTYYSETWIDGRYIGVHEAMQPGASWSGDLKYKDIALTNEETGGKGVIVYTYNKASGCWKADDGSTLTEKQVKALDPDRYTNDIPLSGVVCDGTAEPGVAFSSIPEKTTVTLSYKVNGIDVSWDESDTANGYYVYRKASGESSYKKIANIVAEDGLDLETSYRDTKVTYGKTYSYKVKPYLKQSTGTYAAKISSAKSLKWNLKIKLSYSSVAYNGKAKTPTVTITAGGKKLTDYSVSYENNYEVGTGEVWLQSALDSGVWVKKYFKIVPKQAAIKSVTAGKNMMTVKMTTDVSAKAGSYYQIAYKQKGTSAWKYVRTKDVTKTIKSLKKGKKYYVKVRAYKVVSGKKYYGSFSKTKTTAAIK